MEASEATFNIEESIRIRAPALQRLGLNLLTFAGTTPSIKSALEKECINFSLLIYPKSYGVLPDFPTRNANILANEIMKLIRCYIAAPEIYTKIAMCYTIQKVGSSIFQDANTTTDGMNVRAQEIQDLSLALFNISKKIVGRNDVIAVADFINVHSHEFSKESQFVDVIITAK